MNLTFNNLQFTKLFLKNRIPKTGNSRKASPGMSLIEILVVVTIFAIMGIVITRAVILTIGGGKKSESLVRVRENLNYAIGIIERQIRNANGISVCPNPDNYIIDYTDQFGNPASFSCVNVGSANAFVASGSARLTSDGVVITACSFVCGMSSGDNPPSVTISLTAKDANSTGIQNSSAEASSQIFLRNY